MIGVVVEIIDEKFICVEFKDAENKLIEYDGENTFKTRIYNVQILKKLKEIK